MLSVYVAVGIHTHTHTHTHVFKRDPEILYMLNISDIEISCDFYPFCASHLPPAAFQGSCLHRAGG